MASGVELTSPPCHSVDEALAKLKALVRKRLRDLAVRGLDPLIELNFGEVPEHGLGFSHRDLIPILIRCTRVQAGLSQATLAARMVLTQAQYVSLEKLTSNATLGAICDFERAIGVSILRIYCAPDLLENVERELSNGGGKNL